MVLPIPAFIGQTSGENAVADYPWSQETFERLEKFRSGSLKTALLQMSGHANLAFAVSIGEWMCRRLEDRTDCTATLDYAEGIWAAMVDRRYLAKKQTDDVDYTWTDSAKDVITFVGNRLSFAYFDCKNLDPDRTRDTAQLVAAARHVLSDRPQFESWAKLCLDRLRKLYPAIEGLGPAVPREACDTTRDYDPSCRLEYLNNFLERLSPDTNPFLAKRADLEKLADFAGAPYTAAL